MYQHVYKKLTLLSLFFLLIFHQSIAQTKTVTGRVNDDKGNPVFGATVTVRGSKGGTSTDSSGNFSITAPAGAKALQISSIGFTGTEVNIGSGTNISVTLKFEGTSLNDVVVVGYGTARRKDVTGSVSSISAKDFNQGIITTPMDAVQGKVPGLVITKPDGDPNSNPIIRLRGQTSLLGSQTPLLVVDGVILDNYEVLSSIPTADIVTFDFLKDASAASIYGSRGANGVILITTKRGRSGTFLLEYNGSVSVAKDAKYYDLLNRNDFLSQTKKIFGDSTAQAVDQGGNTDWQRAITRTGYTHSHNLGLSGGTGGFTYHASLDYQNQQGIVINTGRQQLGLRINAEQKALNDKLDIQLNILNTETKHQNVDANIFYWAYNISPTVPEKINGVDNPIYNYNYVNPVWVQNNEVKNSVDNLKQQNLIVNYDVLKGLKVGAGGNLSRFNTQYDYYLPQIPGSAGGLLSQGFKYNSNFNSYKGDIHINYAGSFGKNNITATGVYEYNYYQDDNFYARGNGYLVDPNQNNALQSGISSFNSISSNKEEFKLISFLARVTYNFDNKYYLTGSIRQDGSSKFGINNQRGYFPAASAAWRISKENFLKDVTWIDELKINVGYGITGNSDPIGAYNTQLLLGGTVHTFDPTSTNNPYPVGYGASQNPNPDLKWEKRIGQNLGLEYSFLQHRITGSLSVFNDKTKDMLFNYGVQVPPNFISSVLANVGSMTNKGVELGINVDIIRHKDFGLTLGGQITTVHTRVTSLSGTWNGNAVASNHIQLTSAGGQGLSFNPLTYLQVGYYPSVFFLPHYVGKDQSGNQLLDSAGVKGVSIDGNPTYYYTDPSPKFTYGFNFNVRYRSLSLTGAFNGNYGQKIYDNSRLNLASYGRFPGLNVLKETFTNGLTDKPTTSDYWLEKASYLRLQTLTISYNVPRIKGIENMRVYFAGNNLFVITKYKGLDPEISPYGAPNTTGYSGANGSRAGISNLATSLSGTYGAQGGAGSGQGYLDNNYAGNGFYPRARSFTLGVSISVK
ncbi:SusC/RagA family TonB-linked outer membrane protein [Flavitalea flava]